MLIDLKKLDRESILSTDEWESIKNKDKDEFIKNKEKLLFKIYESQEKKQESFSDFLQRIFLDQYLELKKYANEKGIKIFGDLPFYVNLNSRDLIENKKYFLLNSDGEPTYQAAVPPDAFQKKGQLWGTPVYNWETLEKDGFSYWVEKIKSLSLLYDYLRIDHFRGLESYYRVKWKAKDATDGEWVKAPGDKLLNLLTQISGVKIIAENLGYITPEVDYLMEKYSIPGMKVLQFIDEDLYLKNEKSDTVYYTGTHDNQMLLSWIREKFNPEEELEKDLLWDFIKKVYCSKAAWAIIPFQDLLELDNSARMNTPGTVNGNWTWTWNGNFEELSELENKLNKLTKISDRR